MKLRTASFSQSDVIKNPLIGTPGGCTSSGGGCCSSSGGTCCSVSGGSSCNAGVGPELALVCLQTVG